MRREIIIYIIFWEKRGPHHHCNAMDGFKNYLIVRLQREAFMDPGGAERHFWFWKMQFDVA